MDWEILKRVSRTLSDRCLSCLVLREIIWGLSKKVAGVEQIGLGRGAEMREESIFRVETVAVQDKQGKAAIDLGCL